MLVSPPARVHSTSDSIQCVTAPTVSSGAGQYFNSLVQLFISLLGRTLQDCAGSLCVSLGGQCPRVQLKLGLVERHASAEAARGQLAVRRGELGGEDHIAVGVDGADLLQDAGLDGQAVGQLTAALVERQQPHAVSVW